MNLAFDAAPSIVNLLPKRFRGAGWIIGLYNLQFDALSSEASTSDIEQVQSAGDIYRDIVGFIPVPQILIASLVADFANDLPGGRDSYGDLTNAIGKALDTWVFPRTPLAELPRTGGAWTATAERRDWLNTMEQLPASAFEVRYCVEIRDLPDDGPGGWCDSKRKQIVVANGPANRQVRTLVHEIAHAHGLGYAGYGRDRAEVLVDCVTYCVLGSVGLDVGGESIPYVAGWGEDGALDAIREYAATIDTIARRIEDALALPTPSTGESHIAA